MQIDKEPKKYKVNYTKEGLERLRAGARKGGLRKVKKGFAVLGAEAAKKAAQRRFNKD